jgi:hypothetical protein
MTPDTHAASLYAYFDLMSCERGRVLPPIAIAAISLMAAVPQEPPTADELLDLGLVQQEPPTADELLDLGLVQPVHIRVDTFELTKLGSLLIGLRRQVTEDLCHATTSPKDGCADILIGRCTRAMHKMIT